MKPDDQPTKRPTLVTWLAIAVLILAVANLAGVVISIQRWPVFAALDLSLPLWLLTAIDGLWGVIWLAVAYGLYRQLRWARRLTIVLIAIYQITIIIQQILFARGGYERGRFPFMLAASVVYTLLVFLILNSPRVRQGFDNQSDRSSKETL